VLLLLAIRYRELVDRCYHSFTSCRPTHPPAYQISIPSSISFGDIEGSPKIKSGDADLPRRLLESLESDLRVELERCQQEEEAWYSHSTAIVPVNA